MEGESEATKADARQFMSDVLPTSNASSAAVDVDGIADGHGPQCDMRSWKSTYAAAITAAAYNDDTLMNNVHCLKSIFNSINMPFRNTDRVVLSISIHTFDDR
mmetsp:Transcript_55497/g.61961  ORF Transcript_55497/g.61961 Transcript_55497/m.61961 type:complete len:103 (+) Transcript_55497:108-416(+)